MMVLCCLSGLVLFPFVLLHAWFCVYGLPSLEAYPLLFYYSVLSLIWLLAWLSHFLHSLFYLCEALHTLHHKSELMKQQLVSAQLHCFEYYQGKPERDPSPPGKRAFKREKNVFSASWHASTDHAKSPFSSIKKNKSYTGISHS